ncbi:adenylyl-sulfate kinase [Rathayibacter soli]|uniref:adenylyl-sulfate kinase n=1 Tax=Rathayibacter soli TaxID=3144168 RepID=UPI0027E46C73|nr:adenylyl-sulfate kinase [Glaciibacter superstes]
MVDVVFINGTVGSGKTAAAEALSVIEAEQGHPHALIDCDTIRGLWPPPAGDPFQHELELENVRDLAANYRRAGAQHLIVAGVIEVAAEVARYVTAFGAQRMLVCRLTADPSVLEARLIRRHEGDAAARQWHLHRAGELADILEAAEIDDVTIDTTTRPPRQVAEMIAATAEWTVASGSRDSQIV